MSEVSNNDDEDRNHEAIYNAVLENKPERLNMLLAAGGDVDEFYQDITRIGSKSILHICCEKGREECVRVLLRHGAHVAFRDPWGQTPLMYCMLTQYYEIADLLLMYHPDAVNNQDRYGKSALHVAIESGCLDSVKVLLKYDANPNILTTNGISPLHTLCSNKDIEKSKTKKLLRMLIDAGAQVDLKDFRNKRSPLQMAAVTKNVDLVQMLLQAGANPNTMDNGWRTPLTNVMYEHVRLKKNDSNIDPDVMTIVILLIQSGANVNILEGHEHSNALIMATFLKATSLVRFFLESGAQQHVKFFSGVTPLLIATKNKDIDTAKVLLNYDCNMYAKGRIVKRDVDHFRDPFELSLDDGNIEFILLLIEAGYNPNKAQIKCLTDFTVDPPQKLKDEPELLGWLREYATQPQTLVRILIYRIREILRPDVERRAKLLPLPKSIIEDIQLKGWLC